jgi:uroporphyrin-III C-methyltransferase
LARSKARLIYVGKRGNKKSINQLEINKLLINEAKKNKRVLRLKGGDPFIFGRGGEEALSLKLNKIPYKIVPGATAGIAGLAYAGIPATHRDFNTSITFISAYGAGGEKPETIDWTSFSKTSQLIVIYMGLERINWVCSELIKRGRNKHENIAIISNATNKNQKTLISTLENCSKDLDKNIIDSPALLVIGKNVLLSPILNWYVEDKENISFLKHNKKKYEQYNFI